MPDPPDEQLVDAAMREDLDSFMELCRRHYPALVGVAHAVLHDRHLAEDAAQEALARACRSLSQLADPSRFAAWLMVICRNSARDMLRRSPRLDSLNDHSVVAEGEEPEPVIDAIRDAIARLPEEAREIVYLRYYGNLSYEEMSAVLDISVQAINGRLRRAREAIRQHLARDADIGGHR